MQKIAKSYRYIHDGHTSVITFQIAILFRLSFVIHLECLQRQQMMRPMFLALLHSFALSPINVVILPTFSRSHCLVAIPNWSDYVSPYFDTLIQFADSTAVLPCLFSLFLILLIYWLYEMLVEFCEWNLIVNFLISTADWYGQKH